MFAIKIIAPAMKPFQNFYFFILVELMGIAPMSKVVISKYSTSLVCFFWSGKRGKKQTKLFVPRLDEGSFFGIKSCQKTILVIDTEISYQESEARWLSAFY